MGRVWFSKVCQRARTMCRNSDADRLKVYVLTAEGKWRFACYFYGDQDEARKFVEDVCEGRANGGASYSTYDDSACTSVHVTQFHGLAISKSMVGQ